jgi:hypothetical protein
MTDKAFFYLTMNRFFSNHGHSLKRGKTKGLCDGEARVCRDVKSCRC